ncbi:MAG: YfhO family protein [Actinomycetota bacterium]|nr:YfhO family protein [Actinomycetota bacterium]
MNRTLGKDFRYIGLLLCLILLFFWKAISLQAVFSYGGCDNTTIQYPLRIILSEALKSGKIPLWTPYLYNGFPLFAEPHTGAFYPLNLLYGVLPTHVAYSYSAILHLFLAGLFTYLYARVIRLRPSASFISATAFAFSGSLLGEMGNFVKILTAAWLPLLFLFVELTFRRRRLIYPLLAGVVLGCQLLAGFPQLAFYSLVGAVFYYLFRLVWVWKDCRDGKEVGRFLLLLMLTLIVGVMIASVQLLPTYELVKFSTRSGGLSTELGTTNVGFATEYSLPPQQLVTYLFPYLNILNAPVSVYVGALTVLFSVGALICSKDRYVKFFFWLTLLSVVIALGKYTPVSSFICGLHGFNYFRVPGRILLLATFAFSILAGFGFELLSKPLQPAQKRRITKLIKWFSILILVVIIGILLGSCILHFGKDYILAKARHYVDTHVYGRPPHIYSLEHYYERIDRIYANLVNLFSLANPYIYTPILLILASLLLISQRLRQKLSTTTFQRLAILLLAADFFIFAWQGRLLPAFDMDRFLQKPGVVRFLEGDASLYRVYAWPAWELRKEVYEDKLYPGYHFVANTLQPDTNMRFHISSPSGYIGLMPQRQKNLIDLVERTSYVSEEKKLAYLPRFSKLLGMLNVKYVISPQKVKSDGFQLAYDAEENGIEVNIYKNRDFLPRAFIVSRVEVIKEEAQILERLKNSQFNPQESVVLEEKPSLTFENVDNISKESRVKIVTYSPNKVVVEADLAQSGLLVLSDSYYPGWKTYIDGQEGKIYRANYCLRAVELKKGSHIVTFLYKSLSFKMGAYISIAALLVVLGLGALDISGKWSGKQTTH